MKFDPWKCPECGDPAEGTVEMLVGLAELNFNEDGEAEYGGYTEMWWDGQTTVLDDNGRATLRCPQGHEWLAKAEDLDHA